MNKEIISVNGTAVNKLWNIKPIEHHAAVREMRQTCVCRSLYFALLLAIQPADHFLSEGNFFSQARDTWWL